MRHCGPQLAPFNTIHIDTIAPLQRCMRFILQDVYIATI